MRFLALLPLILLVGCGLYVGTDALKVFPNGLPVETGKAGIDIVPPEVVKATVEVAKSSLGPYGKLLSLLPGAVTLVTSYFFTKRKKGN